MVLINLAFLMEKPTGISTYALNLIPQLRSLDPILLTPHPKAGFRHHPIPPGLTPEQGLVGHLKRLLWTQFTLPRLYRDLGGDLLFSPIPEAPLGWTGPYVVTVYDAIPLRFPKPASPMTLYHRLYVPQVLKQAQHLLCISQATADDAMDFYGVPAQKITVTPLAYDRHRYRHLNLPRSNYFLYLGRHDPYKNLERAIAAFAQLPPSLDCEFWLGGSFDRRYTPNLQQQVRELHLGDRVKFLDYINASDLPILLNQALALVFPSLWEGFGLPILEAMACGCPVIASHVASIPEVAGDAALLVDPYDLQQLADAMVVLAKEEDVRSHLQQLGRDRARHFSWETTGQLSREVLHQLSCSGNP